MTSNLARLTPTHDPLPGLLDELLALKQRILSGTGKQLAGLAVDDTDRDCRASLEDLLNYIVMRRQDLRPLQVRLANAGLSSLGRGEPHVLKNIDRIIGILSRAVSQQPREDGNASCHLDYEAGHRLLRQRAEMLFGAARTQRAEYIMVTMPTAAASNFELVNNLVATGMDAVRINCAHDDSAIWHNMIINIKLAAKLQERSCPILMDLGGHKIRTRHIITGKNKAGMAGKKHLRIHHHDWLVLSRKRGSPEVYDALFDVPVRAVITCTCPDIIKQLQKNESVWIDDGKIGCVIREKRGDAALLQVNRAAPRGGVRIKEEKGLNFPETGWTCQP